MWHSRRKFTFLSITLFWVFWIVTCLNWVQQQKRTKLASASLLIATLQTWLMQPAPVQEIQHQNSSHLKKKKKKKMFVNCHNMSSKSLWMPCICFLFLFFLGRRQTAPCAFKMWLLKSNKADSSGSAKNVSWLQMSKLGCRAVPVDLQFSALQLFSSSTSWGRRNKQVAVEHRCTEAAVTPCINQRLRWPL